MSKKVLVVSVHPDDETLGAGGTLLRHKDNGDEIYELLVTSCWKPTHNDEVIKAQEEYVKRMSSAYGFKNLYWLKIPTTKTDELLTRDLVGKMGEVFKEIRPNVVYIPFGGDTHHDHTLVFNAAWNCTKNFRFPSVEKVYAMEVLSETDYASNVCNNHFISNTFIDISNYLDKKIEILKIFAEEIAPHPFPRSIENIKALATLRGAYANCKYAESFMLLKDIVK